MSVIINGDTGISGVNGSAANPAVKGEDADTGIHFGADTAAITTGGTDKVSIDSSGDATFSGTVKTSKVENANTSNGGVEIDTDGHVQVDGLQMPSAGSTSNRNIIHNGEMLVCNVVNNQTVGAGNPGIVRVPDRFWVTSQGAQAQLEVSRESETDSASGHVCFMRVRTTQAEAALENNDLAYVAQYIEGMNAQRFCYGTPNAKPQALSFWVRSSLTGTFPVNIYRNQAAKICTLSYTINTANTWEQKRLIFPLDTTGTEVAGTFGEGLRVSWPIMAGNTYTGTSATTWTNYIATMWAGTTPFIGIPGTLDATWDLTGVQLEVGDSHTVFESRSWSEYNQDTSRYFQTSFEGSPEASNTSVAGICFFGGSDGMGTTTGFIGSDRQDFVTCMRITPDITVFDLANPRNTNKLHRHVYGIAGSNNQGATISNVSRHGFVVRSDSGGAGSGIIYHYIADAQF